MIWFIKLLHKVVLWTHVIYFRAFLWIWVKIRYILSIKSMNFMQFCNEKWDFSTLNLWFAYFVWSKMSINGIIMSPGMNYTRLKRNMLIFLDFENGFLPTYLSLWFCGLVSPIMVFYRLPLSCMATWICTYMYFSRRHWSKLILSCYRNSLTIS